MKRILSVLLAVCLSFALLCSGALAIKDRDKVSPGFETAVDAFVSLGIVQGDQYGNFDPQGSFTREAAAKIICMLACGVEAAEALKCSKAPFTDVEAKRWSAGYIDWCVQAGYIAGMGDGSFNPTGTISGYGFAKLLLCMLGYDAEAQGLVGNDWEVNTAHLADAEGLFKNNTNVDLSKPAKREACALYAYNAMNTQDTDSIAYVPGGPGSSLGGGQFGYSAYGPDGKTLTLHTTAESLSTGIYRHDRGAILSPEKGASDGIITELDGAGVYISGIRFGLTEDTGLVYLRNNKTLARGQHVYYACGEGKSLEAVYVVTDQRLYKLTKSFVTEGYTAAAQQKELVGGAGVRNSVEVRVEGDFRGKSAIVAVGDSPVTYTLSASEQVEHGHVNVMIGFSDVNADKTFAIVVG